MQPSQSAVDFAALFPPLPLQRHTDGLSINQFVNEFFEDLKKILQY
jgi:hypothetical protein